METDPCNCPYRLSAGTVDSTISENHIQFSIMKVAILVPRVFTRSSHTRVKTLGTRLEGRSGDWNDNSVQGNPAAHHSVKSYLKSVQLEQAQDRASLQSKLRLCSLINFIRLWFPFVLYSKTTRYLPQNGTFNFIS